jgi:phosphohistidine swiveling domain-containing protein
MADARPIGSGLTACPGHGVAGRARWFVNPADVLLIDETELGSVIAFVTKGGMTFLSPILGDLRAVVCTAGGVESHLAILSREFGTPCVMEAKLTEEITDGMALVIEAPDDETAQILLAADG